MALPEQIRKQTEAVQELYKAAADSTTPPVEDEVITPPVEESEVAPVPADEQKASADEVPEETVAQKYRTLQGMYNAEVPRLHQQNREMQQRIKEMEQLFASMTATQTTAAPAVVERLVTDQDVADYGESLDVMRKVTREELGIVAKRIANIEATLHQMQTQVVPQLASVTQRQQLTAEQKFWSDLVAAVPNFRQINDNPEFQAWLLTVDPLTGIARQTYLDDAQHALDAARVANFFHIWLESTAHPAGTSPASELEKQISPGRSRSTGTSATTSQGKMYTPSDIQKFFNDVRIGRYKGREQERSRIERDIFAAQRENRIQRNA